MHISEIKSFLEGHGIMNAKQVKPFGFTLTLQETRSIHDSMKIPKMESISYIYIL